MKLFKALRGDGCAGGTHKGCAVDLLVLGSVVGIARHTGRYYTELSSSFQILLHRDTNEISVIKK